MKETKIITDKCLNLIKNKQYQEVIESCKSVIEKDPNNFKAHYYLSFAYYSIGEFNLAYKFAKKAETLASNKIELMHIYSLTGSILHQMDYLNEAFLYYNASFLMAKELNNIEAQAFILNNIAGIYKATGQLDKALECYQMSLNLKSDEAEKSTIYNNIALTYQQKGNHQKAIEYLHKAIEIDEKLGDYTHATVHKLNLAESYRRAKDLEKAEKHLIEAIRQLKTTNNKYWEAIGYLYLGWLYKDKGKIKDSKEYFTKAYSIFKSIGANGFMQEALNGLESLAKLN
ncbi:MAG: tetratricopeptide repeat protein [Sulfurihydrogenibium sp.]|nr:tetratricopeptide repeat protein [Sulfurihydrogenibium sp.]